MLKHATLRFDDIDLNFDVNMQSRAEPDRLKNGNFLVKYNLTSDYAKGDREVYTTNANLTNQFRLNILYYKDQTTLLASETKVIYSSSFDEETGLATFADIGINVNKYQPQYYSPASNNLNGLDLTYTNLQDLGTLILNYPAITYKTTVQHYMDDGNNQYHMIVDGYVEYTAAEVASISSIGQLIDVNNFKPDGYKARIAFDGPLTVEGIQAAEPISVFYDKMLNERTKNIVISYYNENDNGEYDFITAAVKNVRESEVYNGIMLSQYVGQNDYNPNRLYYSDGVLVDHAFDELIDYDTIELTYTVRYPRSVNTIYIEYYVGDYPNWYRINIDTIQTKYNSAFDTNFDVTSLDFDVDKYKRAEYTNGSIQNANNLTTYRDLISVGVVQVRYGAIDYPITVNYYKDSTDELLGTETVNINALMFFSDTILADIVDLDTYKPDGYQLDLENSYHGEMSLSALTQASPLSVMYQEIEVERTKNIIVRYKQELASTMSTIQTSIITINESDCSGGVRLRDIIPLNAFKPDYYEAGYVDGASSSTVLTFDELESAYDVIYIASYYITPVRYYTDDVHEANWIGSANLQYRVIDFTTSTTLYSLGLNVNQYKPSYSDNGEVQYHGQVTFAALQSIEAINVVYDTIVEPGEDDIEYPQRFLFLEHNDLGPFEYMHPTWTMNHAYINTGVTCDDISKLTVVIESDIIDSTSQSNLAMTNYKFSYLFGSKSNAGYLYMGHYNGANYNDIPGLDSDLYAISHLLQDESSSIPISVYDLAYENLTITRTPKPRGFEYIWSGLATASDHILYKNYQQFYTIFGAGLSVPITIMPNGTSSELLNAKYLFTGINGMYPANSALQQYPSFEQAAVLVGQFGSDSGGVTPFLTKYYYITESIIFGEYYSQYYDVVDGKIFEGGTWVAVPSYEYVLETWTPVTSSYIQVGTKQINASIESIPLYYPIYLYACNNYGSYEGGLSGYGIYSARFYYDGVLIRDFIPVETFDKIGDQVAPSNCLYDKVSKTFFEDATGMNSFNIRDREGWNAADKWKIGHCYVNYYRGNTLFKTSIIYFRGDDFEEEWDPYTRFEIEANQPRYYGTGVIQNIATASFTFDGMKNQVYNIVYPALDQQITVNYYAEQGGERTLLASEDLTINEQTFYQSPSFGDIVRINKYKPDGYSTDYEFTGTKVTLNQMVLNAPYEIVYTPTSGSVATYTTTLIYKKKVFGVRTYEEIARETLTLDETQFRDGEYIDYFINLNKYKPEHYYLDGESYGWYLMDERLTSPEMLQESYEIYYQPEELHKDVNYYTDEWDEANLIASTDWSYKIDDFDPTETFYLIDILDNEYTNKYRPANCAGGILQNSETALDFEALVALEEIAFIYESVEEPNDPESAMYEQKVLYFGDPWAITPQYGRNEINHDLGINYGGKIPYIDLGYKPKDLSRLRVELTGYARPYGIDTKVNNYCELDFGYSAFFGYYGIPDYDVNEYGRGSQVVFKDGVKANKYAKENDVSLGSKGMFYIRPRIPQANGWVYTASGPQFIDGYRYYAGGDLTTAPGHHPQIRYPGIVAQYRKGLRYDTNDNYEEINAFFTYGAEFEYEIPKSRDNDNRYYLTDGYMWDTQTLAGQRSYFNTPMANPFTVIMDAYNDYISIYDYKTSNTPYVQKITNTDHDIFEDREQPKGSLTLFRTTNPTTGKVNIMPFDFYSYNQISLLYGGYSNLLQRGVQQNPYAVALGGQFAVEISVYELVGYSSANTEKDAVGNALHKEQIPIVRENTATINVLFMDYEFPTFPQIEAAAIWGIKIYDRDRLVRWLVPVAEGDVIYDYTMPANGLFDLQTEIFFTNANKGGEYSYTDSNGTAHSVTIGAGDVLPLRCIPDPMIYGKITTNYYDYDNSFIDHQFVNVPTWFWHENTTLEDILKFNDFKPDDYRLDGWLDIDTDLNWESITLSQIFEMGTANVYYRLRTFTKTVTYYQGNTRIGTRDIFYSMYDIENAETLADLGFNIDEFYEPKFAHGRLIFNEQVIADDDVAAFIDAPSPIVVYDKLSAAEAPNLFYVEYYRGGAYDNGLITLDTNDNNYLNCNLTAKVLNPSGAIKYENHFHSALYEDEAYDYFIPYQVHVDNHYTGIHNGPGRMYKTLANIVAEDTYTIIAERNGWGKLKEYRNGWILLNQTTPITGPGQNPDYDVAGSDIATIPFGTNITVTKLTIDRLWAYVPEVESWIKTEDISYDQSGKLYNALAIQVIELDTVDWDNVTSLADMGIDIQKYLLRFHNASTYEYNGAYTAAAFSTLHNIEIVYPETVYNYTCIYYKDNKASANELGRSAFSCTISDWNPDWDTFIATSWKTDDNGDPISPTLYRDTPITLTWDYFGFDRNLYKPTGYFDGIYLWNPRTWDKDNIKFTFDELIKCGTQYVIYPYFDPERFKLWVQANYLGKARMSTESNSYGQTFYRYIPANNPGIQLNLVAADGPLSFYAYKDSDPLNLCYDIYVSGELKNDLTYLDLQERLGSWPDLSLTATTWDEAKIWGNTASSRFDTHMQSIFSDIRGISTTLPAVEDGDKFVINTSNHRAYPTDVFGFGSNVKGMNYYVPVGSEADTLVKITDNLNMSQYNKLPEAGDTYAMQPIPQLQNRTFNLGALDIELPYSGENKTVPPARGVIYEVISYYNFEMIHYWIPVPRGMRYRYNGEDLRIQDNGLFDLMTGQFARSYRASDGAPGWVGLSNVEWTNGDWVDGNDYIYYRNDAIGEPFSYFTGWGFTWEDFLTTHQAGYWIKVNTDHGCYRYPDSLAPYITTLQAGTVLPVTRVTSDAANGVEGEWYYSCGYWFSSADTELYWMGTYSANEDRKTATLVPGAHQSFKVFKIPVNHTSTSTSIVAGAYSLTPQVLTFYWRYDYRYYDEENQVYVDMPMYFDGTTWVPAEYTDLNRTTVNKNYAIASDTTYYSVPIADEKYKLGKYLYGDRVTVLYVCTNNPVWGWTGQGWIGLEGNVSEVE